MAVTQSTVSINPDKHIAGQIDAMAKEDWKLATHFASQQI
jgi:hypothetical protein